MLIRIEFIENGETFTTILTNEKEQMNYPEMDWELQNPIGDPISHISDAEMQPILEMQQ